MAISATINKVSLSISDMDRQYYQQHELTMAMHPSENDFRFIVRVVAFALNAHEDLVFTKGLGADEEPEIWQKSLSGEIQRWIDFGQVDEKRIRKACGRAGQVIVYTYQDRKSDLWWEQNRARLARHANLRVLHIEAEGAEALVSRNMQLNCTIDDGVVYLGNAQTSVSVSVTART
ncbi:YaeQ family protein [Granulosicoccus sp. 3-233]|uniref:YaeQ family protein n=1 Tax=Granulosicoccus sp. 3-233 TaxID=3417969 RepID=UPI003D34945C